MEQIRRIKKAKFTMRRAGLSRSSEYQNLRHVVPSLRRQRDVGEVEVVTEAARYIDHLHKTLIERFTVCGIPDSLKDALGTNDVNELGTQHIMNLVAQMATSQRQQQQHQDSKRSQHHQQIQQETISRRSCSDRQRRRHQPQRRTPPLSIHNHLNNNRRQLVQTDARETTTTMEFKLKEADCKLTHTNTRK